MSGRPIVVTTPVGIGITYIPVNRYSQYTTAQCNLLAAGTFQVDYTLDDIVRPVTNPYDTSATEGAGTAPASAMWSQFIASGTASTQGNLSVQIRALRVNITAGASPQVRITIIQSAEPVG